MNLKTKVSFYSLCFFLLFGCKKDNNFPKEPILTVRSFEKIDQDNAVWSLGFTDGDGDIGVRNDQDEDNFLITIFGVKNDSIFERTGTAYRIPVVQNIRTEKGIEGEFKFEIETRLLRLDSLQDDPATRYDSAFYQGFVIDRSGNESNVVETPIFPI